ncbi:MAG TPA: PstS family phosphate ABC transporter substrate-binding protein [Armatimonadota bacterium]|jgi:phosphate transport system substrate-binding protein
MKMVKCMALAIAATAAVSAGATVNLKGSDTILPLAQRLAEAYQTTHKGADIAVTGGGSGVGLTALINGNTDIADASRPIQPKEYAGAKARGFVPVATRVAKDGICVIVSKSNPVKTLTMDQIAGIYTGRINNWNQVGGPNRRIAVTGRDSSSGTFVFFRDTLFPGQNYRPDMLALPSNNAIVQTVARDEGAIGYVGLAYYNPSKVRALGVAEKGGKPVEPSVKSVSSGDYPLFRYLFMVTRGKPSGEEGSFLKFALSPEGQRIVGEVGYVALK